MKSRPLRAEFNALCLHGNDGVCGLSEGAVHTHTHTHTQNALGTKYLELKRKEHTQLKQQ